MKDRDQTIVALSQFHYCWGDDEMTDQNVMRSLGKNNCTHGAITFDITNLITKQIILRKL